MEDMEDHMRHRVHGIKALFLVLAAAGILLAAAAPAKQARAKFREEKWDFGRIEQGELLTHEFVFRNEGDAPLVIEKITTSCGCTAALASEDRIEPGREGKIKASLDTRGYGGRVVKYIYVESNDASVSRRELAVSAEIDIPPQPRIELDRYNIDLGLSLEGEETATTFGISNAGELELAVTATHPEFLFFHGNKPARFPLNIASGKSAELEIRFPARNKVGMLRDYVLIKSNDPMKPTLSIYISRYVVTKKELKDLFTKYKKILD